MRHLDPWQYKKSGIIGKQMPPFFQDVFVPADEGVPGTDMIGGRGKGQASNWTIICIGDIFQMLAHRLTVAEIMKLMDKAVEQFFSGALSDLAQDNRSKFSHCGIDGILSYDNFFRRLTPGKRIGRGGFSRWQREVPFPLQFEHQSPADHVLEITVGLHPIPGPTDLTR